MKEKLLHTPDGVRDIYGREYEDKLCIQDRLHHELKLYGYQDIQSPTFEYFEIFSNKIGTIPSKELYKFFDKEGNTLVLRPDITPSIARATAKYFMDEKKPLRFCYMGNTFINAGELQGRLKETTQIGAELIGDASVEADAEIISLVAASMKTAGLRDFQISIGNVEFFKGLCSEYGIDDEAEMMLRDYISNKNYFGTMDILDSLNLPAEAKDAILKISELFGSVETIRLAKKLVSNERSIHAIERLEQLYELLHVYEAEQYVTFDLGMLSKYHYYTGMIFRAYTYGSGDAVIKGGRYDALLNEFGRNSAAVGFAVTVDQLLSALSRQSIMIERQKPQELLIYPQTYSKTAIRYAEGLRKSGISIELLPVTEDLSAKDYLEQAKNNHIHIAIVIRDEHHAVCHDLCNGQTEEINI
ncbi:MAG: ATP phosphoribosyltransferase regulatory subunit [bacterium]|nr:ATP phosphoribosyltransferase regulatory subunit [bacterium]